MFERDAKGLSTKPVEIEVERGRIRSFAQVLGADDPIHSDVAAARARGFPDLVAPPTFFVVLEALADEALARMGEPSAVELIGGDYRYLLHGDERYRYSGHVCAGDTVVMATEVGDFYDRKGGLLEFASLMSEVRHAARGRLVTRERTLIHRLPDA